MYRWFLLFYFKDVSYLQWEQWQPASQQPQTERDEPSWQVSMFSFTGKSPGWVQLVVSAVDSICLHIYTYRTESGKTHHSILTFFFLLFWRRGLTLWCWVLMLMSFYFLYSKLDTRKVVVPLLIVFDMMAVVSACCSLSHDVLKVLQETLYNSNVCVNDNAAEFRRVRPCVCYIKGL